MLAGNTPASPNPSAERATMKLIKKLPAKVFLGSNDNAFKGAFMLWQHEGN